jgi:hypothetical protein
MLEWILLLLLLLGFAAPVRVESVQQPPVMMMPTPTPMGTMADPEGPVFTDAQVFPVAVESATAYYTADAPPRIAVFVTGTLPTGCTGLAMEMTEFQDGDTVYVTIGQVVPGDVACPAVIVPYSDVLTLEGEYDMNVRVVVNDVPANQNLETAQVVDLMQVVVESVVAVPSETNPQAIEVTVTGSLPTGCQDLPVQYIYDQQGSVVNVSLHQLVPPDTICPMMLLPYEETFELTGNFETGTAVIVNGVIANEDPENVNLMPFVVENVTAVQTRSMPYEISITVEGTLPTGCDSLPIQIVQYRQMNTAYVRLNQRVPRDVVCTMMLIPFSETIRLDGTFDGPVRIDVNGFVVES